MSVYLLFLSKYCSVLTLPMTMWDDKMPTDERKWGEWCRLPDSALGDYWPSDAASGGPSASGPRLPVVTETGKTRDARYYWPAVSFHTKARATLILLVFQESSAFFKESRGNYLTHFLIIFKESYRIRCWNMPTMLPSEKACKTMCAKL